MGKKEFEAYLEEHEDEIAASKGFVQQRNEFIEHVDELYNKIYEWLADYARDGRISIEDTTYTVEDSHTQRHEMKILLLLIGNKFIQITPMNAFGFLELGGHGEVKMRGPWGVVEFSLVGEEQLEWVIVRRGIQPKQHRPITEDSFKDALMWICGPHVWKNNEDQEF